MTQVGLPSQPLSRQVRDAAPLRSKPGRHVIVAVAFSVVPDGVTDTPLSGVGSPQSY